MGDQARHGPLFSGTLDSCTPWYAVHNVLSVLQPPARKRYGATCSEWMRHNGHAGRFNLHVRCLDANLYASNLPLSNVRSRQVEDQDVHTVNI